MGVAGRLRGEVDGLAVVAERHLERRLGRVGGVHGVRAARPADAQVDGVVAHDHVGQPGLDGQLGQHRRGHRAGAGDPELGAERPVPDAEEVGDLVRRRPLGDAERLDDEAVDVGRRQPGIGEGETAGLDGQRRHRTRIAPLRIGLADADDGDRHRATATLRAGPVAGRFELREDRALEQLEAAPAVLGRQAAHERLEHELTFGPEPLGEGEALVGRDDGELRAGLQIRDRLGQRVGRRPDTALECPRRVRVRRVHHVWGHDGPVALGIVGHEEEQRAALWSPRAAPAARGVRARPRRSHGDPARPGSSCRPDGRRGRPTPRSTPRCRGAAGASARASAEPPR